MAGKLLRKSSFFITTIIVGLLVLIGAWFFYIQPQLPRPLGDRLEYIGKRDYGCNWLCDSRPGTTYLYATDLTPPELVDYFGKAQATQPISDVERWQNRGSAFSVELLNTEAAESFFIYFEAKPNQEVETDFGSVQLTKKYIVRVDYDYYNIAKDSL